MDNGAWPAGMTTTHSPNPSAPLPDCVVRLINHAKNANKKWFRMKILFKWAKEACWVQAEHIWHRWTAARDPPGLTMSVLLMILLYYSFSVLCYWVNRHMLWKHKPLLLLFYEFHPSRSEDNVYASIFYDLLWFDFLLGVIHWQEQQWWRSWDLKNMFIACWGYKVH